ncbi:SDR family oxidoreductase [Tabrizicola sp.]|uniref:SDR family NAD(P)-dependent oxidoreductase n=1 Tax=Tabrizicola sp. TaxID=2005166 RepID=UPI00262952FC|nr:SDR family oxidoreductase [Tabrizicola sp.]MDM7932214.1 SDR family oxidoreductase [Tabrizicola sp.]
MAGKTATPEHGLKDRFGPTALVTGASDGIGRAFAARLAEQGFDLILVARREAALQEIALDLGARFGVEVRVLAIDLTETGAVSTLLSRTEDAPVGMVVAAAGFGSIGPFLEQDPGSELGMIDLNCRSVVELSHGFAQRLASRRRGGIVLFSSLVGFNGAPLSATYAATKGFMQSFAEGIAAELHPLGVSVLSVAPGPVHTGFAARAGMRMGQAATPDTVAQGALAALGRRGTVRPGFQAKFLGWSLAMLPRWGRVRVMGLIMKGMTGKKPALNVAATKSGSL